MDRWQIRVNPWFQVKRAVQDQIEREETSRDAIVPADQAEICVVNNEGKENQQNEVSPPEA
jgi:hypothetical protein